MALPGREDRGGGGAGSPAAPSASGPLEDLLADPEVEEVMVNGRRQVYVERHGWIEPTDVVFADEEELRNAIERILAPLGRRIDELSPTLTREPSASRASTIGLSSSTRRPSGARMRSIALRSSSSSAKATSVGLDPPAALDVDAASGR